MQNSEQGTGVTGVIETPKDSRNKYTWSPADDAFRLTKVLPVGAVFPFHFGFIPGTLAPDGDPLDVLMLMDAPAFPGCLVDLRLVGVIEAEQTERDGRRAKNDRLIAVAEESNEHRDVRSIADLSAALLDEIEHFFRSYNQIAGKRFEPAGREGPERAHAILEEARHRAREQAGRAGAPRPLAGDGRSPLG